MIMKTKLLLIILFLTAFNSFGQEIDIKVSGLSYANESTYTFADSQVMAINGGINFRIENLSAPNLILFGTPRVELDGLNADQFLINSQPSGSIANGGGSNCSISFRPTSLGIKTAKISIINNDSDEGVYEIILTGTAVASKLSAIVITPSPDFTYSSLIDYHNFQADNITSPANGFKLVSYTLRDGGTGTPSDVDNLPTILTDLTFKITNWTNIRSLSLYDGATEVGIDQDVTGEFVTFTDLNIIAADGGTKQFEVLATFSESVVDSQYLILQITAAETDVTGSNFAAANAGGVSTASNRNRIAVVATQLSFAQQPSDTDTFEVMNPAVTIEAVDILGNRDINYNGTVILTTSGSFHTSGTGTLNDGSQNAVAGIATFPQIVHGVNGLALNLTANSGSLTAGTSQLFDITAASAITNYYRSTSSGKWNELTSWESSGNNTTWTAATLIPSAASRSIIIRSGHEITCDSNEVVDQLTVSAGGILKIVTGGTFTLKRVSGNDLLVAGTLEYAGGTLDQTTYSAVIAVTGKYIHSIASSSLTLPTITWGSASTCSVTGMNNAVPITAVNMGQNFRNFIWDNPNQLDFVNINDPAFAVLTKLTLESSTANKLCFSSTGVRNNTIAALEIKGGELVGYSGAASGTLKITTTTIQNGKFTFSTSSGTSTLNNTGAFVINNNGQFVLADNAGANTFNAGNYIIVNNNGQFTGAISSGATTMNVTSYIRLNNSGQFTFNTASAASTLAVSNYILLNTDSQFIFNNASTFNTLTTTSYLRINNNAKFICSNGNGTSDLIIGTDLLLYNAGSLILENTSSAAGTTNIQVLRNLASSSTSVKAIDFGVGDVVGNTISVAGNFTKSGTGIFTTSSTTFEPVGFIFNGTTQGFAYTGTESAGVNFTVNTTGIFTLNNNYFFNSTTALPLTEFTVNSGTLNLRNYYFKGHATKARFNIANGVTIETIHSNGLGGTSATGSFNNFGSIGSTLANGRVSFGTNVNYKLNATNTSTPFPVGGTWTTPNNISFGGLAGLITINYTTPFTLNGVLTIESGKTLRLNPTAGAHLNLKNTMVINGTFDTNGENQVLDGTGTPTIALNGTFITKNTQGFNGTNASVPSIPINMGDNSTVNYGGANQTITSYTNYKNLVVSGTGTKTLGTSIITLDKALDVTASLLKIEPDKTLSVTDKITTINTSDTAGILVESDGSLVQVNDVDNETTNLNTGNVKIVRISKPLFRYDFTYWSTPITTSAGYTLNNLSPITLFDKYFKWNHEAEPQIWQKINYGTEVMIPGRGYSVRAPQSYPIETVGGIGQNYMANFVGVPNNGQVTHAVTGSDETNKWSFLGNPYPSAIDAEKFLDANTEILGGTLYFWTHNTNASNGGSGSFYIYNSADYASWNGTGSTATSTDAGENPNFNAPSGNITSGQSFFVKAIASGTAVFTNAMRVIGDNNQFFKTNNSSNDDVITNKNRVWLNLKAENKGFSQILVGYVPNATNAYDIRFDGESFGGNQVTFYSILDTKNLVIQGRGLPFNIQDEVPLGYNATVTGNLNISIDHTDGLLDNQAVYLKDNLLNVVHNLKDSAYTFATVPGTFNARFVLRYQPEVDLENPTFEDQIKGVSIRKNNTTLYVSSAYETIKNIAIYDLTGRLIFEQKNCNCNQFNTAEALPQHQTLIVKVQLSNDGMVTKKVL